MGTNDYDDIELRDKVGLNSPHGEPVKDGQTDDEDDKVTIEYQWLFNLILKKSVF